jgi:predicted DNA-binding protein (MmcQ/YjbR family)
MPKTDPTLARMRAICLALPDTKETPTWGEPHFRVGEKIFAGWGTTDAGPSIGFKLEREHAAALVEDDPRFTRAPYVGQHGWVSMDVSRVTDWDEVRALVEESYRLIAPKKSLAKRAAAGASDSGAFAARLRTRTVTSGRAPGPRRGSRR